MTSMGISSGLISEIAALIIWLWYSSWWRYAFSPFSVSLISTMRRSSLLLWRSTYALRTRLLTAVVRELSVMFSFFATADIFLPFPIPIASMTCISLLVISLNSSVITAFPSRSHILLINSTSTSLMVLYVSLICLLLSFPYFQPETLFFLFPYSNL